MWTNAATQAVNDWMVSDSLRVEQWKAAAQDALSVARLLPLDGVTGAYAAAHLASLLRLTFGLHYGRGELTPPWNGILSVALNEVDWQQIAAAFIAGLEDDDNTH